MISKPPTAKDVLADNHAKANENGIGNTDKSIASQSITAENKTAYDRLQQVIGETHTAIKTQMFQHLAHTLESISSRNDSRDNHQQDKEVVNRRKPRCQCTKVHDTQSYDKED